MTTSEITSFDQNNRRVINYTGEGSLSAFGRKISLFTLKLIEYLIAAGLVSTSIAVYVSYQNPSYKDYVGLAILVLIFLLFLFFFNRRGVKNVEKAAYQAELAKKAELYTYLLSSNNSLSEKYTVIPARQKALQYCQDLIDDYKNIRNLSRNLYYLLQISTVILSGVTPILVLVDKLEAGQAWLKWLPVICPAVASIVASIVTSFPFQKNWVAANTVVELLEAEQEKFILGVSPLYRCYDVANEAEQQQKVSQAVEQFIVQVNNIHLQQVQQLTESQTDKKDKDSSSSTTGSDSSNTSNA